MGSGCSALEENILFEFDKKYTVVYQTGELISGTVRFLNDGQVELKLKNIIIEVVGELIYTTTRGPNLAKSTDIHVVPFFTERQIVRSANTKSDFALESGNHTWPFALRLAASLPSTLEQTRPNGPYVRYVVRVRLNQSEWYKRNIQKASFIVVQCLSSPMCTIPSGDENKNGKSVHLHAVLQKNIVIAGEKLSLCIDLNNPNRATISRISLTFIQQQRLGPAGKDDVVLLKQNLKDIDDFHGEHLQNKFEFRLPDKIVPSCSCIPPQWSAKRPLVVSYELHVEAHVHGLCYNVTLRLPLTVTNTAQRMGVCNE
jgi:hypothetical protein